MARRPIARQLGTSIAFYRKGSAVVAEITIYLLGLFLAHEWLENLLAIFRFLGEIAHFLKFSSTAHSAEPNHLRLLLPFRGDVLSVVFQKATRWIFWDFRHLNGLLTIRKQRENRPQKSSPDHGAADHLNREDGICVRVVIISGNACKFNNFLLFSAISEPGKSRSCKLGSTVSALYTCQNSHIFQLVYSMLITPQVLCVKGVENKWH